MSDFKKLQSMFQRYGVPMEKPGFYDDPNFIAQENRDPRYLQNYARFVRDQPYTDEYLNRAREVTTAAATFLHSELAADGRRGACIDAAGVLQRMLEREGIWSYFVHGGVTVRFPANSRLRPQYYYPLVHPNNPAKTGHAWLTVPPFQVVDVTLKLQPYTNEQHRHIPELVIAEEVTVSATISVDELAEPELRELHYRRTGGELTAENIAPSLKAFIGEFPPFELTWEATGVQLKYIPTNISAMDAPLEGMKNLCLRGKYPEQLYREYLQRRT